MVNLLNVKYRENDKAVRNVERIEDCGIGEISANYLVKKGKDCIS